MSNDSKENDRGEEEENLQRYDELKKVFGLLKKEWNYCFDNTQESYLSRAEIAVSYINQKINFFWTEDLLQVVYGHPIFERISKLFDKFCRKEARQRKKEIMANTLAGEDQIVATDSSLNRINTVIVDYAEQVSFIKHKLMTSS